MIIYNKVNDLKSQPIWLYIKRHNFTGLMYFGKTTTKDPYKYPGSGKYWTAHLKKHGTAVSTIWCKEFYDLGELTSFAIKFSIENDIVKSPEWANLVIENGIDGTTPGTKFGTMSYAHRSKISLALTGKHKSIAAKEACRKRMLGNQLRKGTNHTAESKQRISEARTGKTASLETRAKMAISKRGNTYSLGHKHSIETKEKMSRSAAKIKSNSHRENISKGKKGKQQKIVVCPHCSKSGGVSNLTRYHFDNCKLITSGNQ